MDLELPRPYLPDSARRRGIRVLGFVGSSGSGKTTVIEQLIPLLSKQGLRVGVIKHAHHGFDMDRPGKDSFRARAAGAAQVLVASNERWVLMGEVPTPAAEPNFHTMLGKFDPEQVDLVLAEGFSGVAYPKIEVYRPGRGQPPRCWPNDPGLIALATDAAIETASPVTLLDLNRVDLIAEFVWTLLPDLQPVELTNVD
jgi:molybdopterin-guanine dinucleotide biosynthesis protein B